MGQRKYFSPSDRNGFYSRIITALFMLMVILLLLDGCCSYKEQKETTRDTILTDIKVDSINFENKPVLNYDSLKPNLVIKPFEFSIDTVIKSNNKADTVKIYYTYPENFLNFSYLPEPDSVFREIITEKITKIEELTFWDVLPYLISTAFVFFVIGYITSKFR